jgi:hypothetical protein
MIINGIQAAALEHEGMRTVPWNGGTSKRGRATRLISTDHFAVGFICVYTFTMLVLYSECLRITGSELTLSSGGAIALPHGILHLLQHVPPHQ